MRAAREQRHQHHQIGQREQPLFRLISGSLRRSRDNTQVTAAREIMHVLHADPRQAGYFRIREDFLARLYRNHSGPLLLLRRFRPSTFLDATRSVKDT